MGLEAQREICMNYINSSGKQFIKEFQDVESGTHRTRPGLLEAIDYCKENDCELVFAKLDRLARDVEFTFRVINTGIQVHFCDMPQLNTLILGVMATVAQYERELTSAQTKQVCRRCDFPPCAQFAMLQRNQLIGKHYERTRIKQRAIN